MPLMCKGCGASVPEGRAICPRCRGLDLEHIQGVSGAGGGADVVEAYHRFQRRRRLALLAAAGTTLMLVLCAVLLSATIKDLIPGGVGGAGRRGEELTVLSAVRGMFIFLAWNPIPLIALALALGIYSFRGWHRALTGERATTEFSILASLAGKPHPRQ